MTTFLDTNVLIALLNPNEKFHSWSVSQLQTCKAKGPAIISDIVYCEFSIGMESRQHVDAAVMQFGLERFTGNDDAFFRAGMAYKKYKSNNGKKTNVLPDFIIGAIAEVMNAPLVTANKKDYVGYFPKVEVICP